MNILIPRTTTNNEEKEGITSKGEKQEVKWITNTIKLTKMKLGKNV